MPLSDKLAKFFCLKKLLFQVGGTVFFQKTRIWTFETSNLVTDNSLWTEVSKIRCVHWFEFSKKITRAKKKITPEMEMSLLVDNSK